MSSSKSSQVGAKPKTRKQSGSKLSEFIGPGKELNPTEVPTARTALQRGLLIKEKWLIEESLSKTQIRAADVCKELAPIILAQWQKSNPQFRHPVVIKAESLVQKLERLWNRANSVAQGGKGKQKLEEELERVLDVTVCPHPILLCQEEGSGCEKGEECVPKAHIKCDCPLASKVPSLELRWLAFQRRKRGEKSQMMMSNVDKVESQRQEAAAKRKEAALEAQLRKKKKEVEMERMLMERQEESNLLELEENMENCEVEAESMKEFRPPPAQEKEAARVLVDALLKERLGDSAYLVARFLERPKLKRNTMGVQNTAKASLRYFSVHAVCLSSLCQ